LAAWVAASPLHKITAIDSALWLGATLHPFQHGELIEIQGFSIKTVMNSNASHFEFSQAAQNP